MHIIFVDDDPHELATTTRYLKKMGHEVTAFNNLADATRYLDTHEPELLLCDYHFPGAATGLMLAERVRNLYPAAVIVMVSNYRESEHVVHAMRLDLDHYVARPISLAVLHESLLDAVNRRRQRRPPVTETLEYGPLKLDKERQMAVWHEEPIALTPAEFAILSHLVRHKEKLVTAVDLCALAKGERTNLEAAMDTLKPYIFRLRTKLARNGKHPQPIENLRGVGYRLVVKETGSGEGEQGKDAAGPGAPQ